MTRMPALFVSHGSPMILLQQDGAAAFLRGLADLLPRPKAIIAITAHWETAEPALSLAEHPDTIHDFGGFPDELYRMTYGAPGAPDLARRAQALLGHAAQTDEHRGLDHGAWVPLRLAWPGADIPVTQLSVQPRQDPAHHYRLGQALAPLRQEGVLILASGALTHNLRAYFGGSAEAVTQARAFADWMAAAVEQGRIGDLLEYGARAPFARQAHPTDEHLLPLFVALGAGGPGRVLYRGMDGALAMDAYAFG